VGKVDWLKRENEEGRYTKAEGCAKRREPVGLEKAFLSADGEDRTPKCRERKRAGREKGGGGKLKLVIEEERTRAGEGWQGCISFD